MKLQKSAKYSHFRVLLKTTKMLGINSIPVRVTITQSHRWLKIAVCGFSFFLKNEFVRYLYATQIFQRISLAFLHSPLCIIMNIIHLAFITKNKLAVCYFIRYQRAYSYTIPSWYYSDSVSSFCGRKAKALSMASDTFACAF